MAYDRKAMAAELAKRNRESEERKDDSGKFGKIFRDGTEAKFWKCKEGEHVIDIVPYMAGKQHPRLKEGQPDHVLDVWVHYGVGITEDAVICTERTYGKPCPVCQYQAELQQQDGFDEKAVKALYPKRRAIYNIICRDSAQEERNGVMVWDTSHFLTEKNILAITRTRNGRVNFADPDNGRSISFVREGNTAVTTKYLGFRFEERDPLLDEDLDTAFCLDELIVIPEYDALKAKFHEGIKAKTVSKKAEDDDGTPERRRRDERRSKNDDDGESRATRRQRPSDDEDDRPSRRRRDDEADDQKASEESPRRRTEDDEEDRPSRRRRAEADEDDKKTMTRSDDEDDAPKTTRRRRGDDSDSPRCPHGMTFGTDFNTDETCDDCSAFRECKKAGMPAKKPADEKAVEEKAEEKAEEKVEEKPAEDPPARRRRRPVED